MIPPGEVSEQKRLPRFSRAERAVHRTTAALVLVCILTAAILYNGSFSLAVGHRHVVELVHVYCGFALPVPMFLGLVSAAYRADLTRLNRFTSGDFRWLRKRTRSAARAEVGKFNAGQKLNSALSSGAILVLLGSGILMYYPSLVRLAWRSGATFVHDWTALALGILVIGHIRLALNDREARRGMRTGLVSPEWAQAEHPTWAAEVNP